MMRSSGFHQGRSQWWSIDQHHGLETLILMPTEKESRHCEWSWKRKDGLLKHYF
ncbi:hypothetical protein Goshw_010572, partial [Gossypium schwendimanii]|nr:hypothetical protein [Gossypium schwendimanii]